MKSQNFGFPEVEILKEFIGWLMLLEIELPSLNKKRPKNLLTNLENFANLLTVSKTNKNINQKQKENKMTENEAVTETVTKRVGKKPTPINLPAGEFTLRDVAADCSLKRVSIFLRLKKMVERGEIEACGKRPTGGVGHPQTVYRRIGG